MDSNPGTGHTSKDYSYQNLQKASFINEDLSYAKFLNCDLRGTDFSGSNLAGANFTNVKTGLRPKNVILIFLGALIVSLLSGYMATLAGNTVQIMIKSNDQKIQAAGFITVGISFLFIIYAYLRGTHTAVRYLIVPVVIVAVLIAATAYFSGYGTGRGMLYLILALALVVVMIIVGTIARATAGALSGFLFLLVALSGGMFGKSVGGGIGTVVMAISCALISKKALKGTQGFEGLQKFALYFTSKLGTSFRDCHMSNADFTRSKAIRNADFSKANMSFVHWGDSKKINCILPPSQQLQKV